MVGRLIGLLVGALLATLPWPAAAVADHVGIEALVSARLKQLRPNSALVEVTWTIDCRGGGTEGFYGRDLRLFDEETGEETYLGGIFSSAGDTDHTLERRQRDRRLRPELTAQCSRYDEFGTLHGSEIVVVSGVPVTIPAKGAAGTGGDGGGGSGGGGSGGPLPDQPLRPGGCANELVGTAGPDQIEAGAAGDLVLALGGADLVRAGDGHDCLLGHSGNDRLIGEDGRDRITGGRGADRLVGGPAQNAYDAGSGEDKVAARNGKRETVRCGPGEDFVRADRGDRLRGCERVRVGR